ncbi:13066_t:CDS:2, partial [Racocetra persica]
KDDIALLDAHHSEEIFDKYIIRVAGKSFIVIDHPFEVYELPDIYKYIDRNLPFRLVLDIDARQNSDPMNPELPSLDRTVIARMLVEKASKLSKPDNSPVRVCAYYGDMDGKQRQKDFSDINITWSELDCIAYTNTVEAGISFEVTGHFDIVIAITNITTPVHKNSNKLFHPPAIKSHREWDNNTISYKIDESPAVIIFIEVEHQKRLSARYFIEKLCSLIASTSASFQLIKMDKSREVIGNRKRIYNEVRVEVLVIKEMDFNAVATSRNLSLEEAEVLKFDQECSIADTMALKPNRSDICKNFPISVESVVRGGVSLFTIEKNKQSSLQNLIQMNYSSDNLSMLIGIIWEHEETKAWRNNILMKFLYHPNLTPLKHRTGALYNAFIKTNTLEPEHILALIRALD